MLRRIYLDNFRCFSNFELYLESTVLLTGLNGSGKSSLFDAIEILRRLVGEGQDVYLLLPEDSRTKWDQRLEQTFELDVAGQAGELFKYRLQLEQDPPSNRCRIRKEILELELDGKRGYLFRFEDGLVTLYRDDFSKGPEFRMDWRRSALSSVGESRDNTRLVEFRRWLERLVIARMDPARMIAASDQEAAQPSRSFENFVAWYRFLSDQDPTQLTQLFEEIRGMVPGFVRLGFEYRNGQKVLHAFFKPGGELAGKTYDVSFDRLSDGQRILIAMSFLAMASAKEPRVLFLDEPDNFIALRELQPLIHRFCENVGDCGGQVVLASHHPELIDHVGIDQKLQLFREESGPVRARALDSIAIAGLTLSEAVPRGGAPPSLSKALH